MDEWGQPIAAPEGQAAPAGESFSDAVAVQLPLAMPTGVRKPYFLFGDATNGVDLWFADLARPTADQYTAKGSAAITPNDASEVTSAATYDKGEWSVILKRPLASSGGDSFTQGTFVPIAFSTWDGGMRERGNKRGLTQWASLYVEPQAVVDAVSSSIVCGGCGTRLRITARASQRERTAAIMRHFSTCPARQGRR